MEIPAQVLGHVLAQLKILQGRAGSIKAKGDVTGNLSGEEERLLEIAVKRLETMTTAPDKPRVSEYLVGYRCQTDRPFLQNNLDFFLLLLFAGSHGEGQYCLQIFQHLNHCYQCFEEFSEVMRYYYLRLREDDPGEKQA